MFSNNLKLDQASQETGALQPQYTAKAKRRFEVLNLGTALIVLGILIFALDLLKGAFITMGAPIPATNSNPATVVNAVTTTHPLTIVQIAQNVTPATVKIINEQVPTSSLADSSSTGSTSATVAIPLPVDVGTGIIYDKAGFILTNNHVISGATALVVRLPDGRSYPATLIGGDPQTDLAVIKINPNNDVLPVAPLGDSSALQVGERVVAIGYAINLQGAPTLTEGIVSALNRSISEPTAGQHPVNPTTQLNGLIQTDAVINPGNSGGPLINAQGQVVGLNTLIDGNRISFAISIKQARAIAQQMISQSSQ